MKKHLVLILALCLALMLFAGCGGNTDDTYSKFSSAVEKTNALESLQGTATMIMTIDSDEILMTTDFKQKIENGNLTVYQKHSYKGELLSEQYYSDGFMYMSMFMFGEEIKFKKETPMEDAKTMSVVDFKKKDLIRSSSEEVGKGTKYSVVIPSSAIKSYIKYNLDNAIDEEGTTYSDVTMHFIIDKAGYICELYMKFSVSISNPDGPDLSGFAEMTMTFNDPGEDVTIDLPDFSDYIDASNF